MQTLLDSALGAGQAITRVSAQLNFDQMERTEERFDPTPVAKQETRTVEKTKGLRRRADAPPAGTPPPGAPSPPHESDQQRRHPRVGERHLRGVADRRADADEPGRDPAPSVAVLVNTASKVTEGADKKEAREPVPRSAEDLEKIRRVVMGAVGFNEARGDEVTVVEMPFDTTQRDRERALLEHDVSPVLAPLPWWRSKPVLIGAVGGGVGLGLIVGAWLFMRGRKRRPVSLSRSVPADQARAAMPAERLAAASDGVTFDTEIPEELREREDIRQKALGLAKAEPEVAAQLIRAWMVKKRSLAPAGAGRDGG